MGLDFFNGFFQHQNPPAISEGSRTKEGELQATCNEGSSRWIYLAGPWTLKEIDISIVASIMLSGALLPVSFRKFFFELSCRSTICF